MNNRNLNRRTLLLALLRGLLASSLLMKLAPSALAQTRALTFGQLYDQVTFSGVVFSDLLKSLAGKEVRVRGYMAPPLKPKLDFFVLTRYPMSSCPFCSEIEDWPADIIFTRVLGNKNIKATKNPIEVRGRLELGPKKDPETGFLSMVRIYAKEVKQL